MLVDDEGTIVGVTTPLCDLARRPPEDLRGRPIDGVLLRREDQRLLVTSEGDVPVEAFVLGLLEGETGSRLVIVRESRDARDATLRDRFRQTAHGINNALGAIRYRVGGLSGDVDRRIQSELDHIDEAAERAAELLRALSQEVRASSAPSEASSGRVAVLLAEEDPQLRSVIARGLRQRGLDVAAVPIDEASPALTDASRTIDVVVSSSDAVIAEARHARPRVSVLGIGPSAPPDTAFLPKPFAISTLHQRILALAPAPTARNSAPATPESGRA